MNIIIIILGFGHTQLYSGITPGGLRGLNVVVGIEPRLVVCMAGAPKYCIIAPTPNMNIREESWISYTI